VNGVEGFILSVCLAVVCVMLLTMRG